MNSSQELGTAPIGKLLVRFSVPAIIAMLTNAVYNIVDRIFVGRFIGEQALAGLTIAFPLMLTIFAMGTLIGHGGANLISLSLGEANKTKANLLLSQTLLTTLLLGSALILAGYTFMTPLLTKLGARGAVLTFGENYLSIIYVGILFQLMSYTLNSIVRAEGFPLLSMVSMVVAGLGNMFLDYLFIVKFRMGVEGAALATIMCQSMGFLILLQHFLRKKSHLRIHLRNLFPDFKLILKIASVGSATFISTLGASISMMMLNKFLGIYGGDRAITSMGAINSLYTLFLMPIIGLQGGMQPIIGYNFGAKQYERAQKAFLSATLIGMAFASLIFALLQMFPSLFIGFFMDKNSPTMEVAVQGLQIFVTMLPLLSLVLFSSGYFQAIAQGKKALLIGSLRQFLFLVPLLFILPRFLGLEGVWMSTPLADLFAVVIALCLIIPEFQSERRGQKTVVKPL